MDPDGRITAFLEKTEGRTSKDRKDKRRPINGGVYVFEKKLLSKIHARGPIWLESKVFPWLAAGQRAYGFVKETYFVDIGVPDDLRRAQNDLQEWFGVSNPD
jgi:NDP-sugar pyrophosphorylase family protein